MAKILNRATVENCEILWTDKINQYFWFNSVFAKYRNKNYYCCWLQSFSQATQAVTFHLQNVV